MPIQTLNAYHSHLKARLEWSLVVGRLCVTSTLTLIFPGEHERLVRLDQRDVASTDASLLFPHDAEPRHRSCARSARICGSCEPRSVRAESWRSVHVASALARDEATRTGPACPARTQATDPRGQRMENCTFSPISPSCSAPSKMRSSRRRDVMHLPPASITSSTKEQRLALPPPPAAITRVPIELIVPAQIIYRQR